MNIPNLTGAAHRVTVVPTWRRLLSASLGAAALLLVTACGGGGDPASDSLAAETGGSTSTVSITGVAAVGAPITGQTVTVTNAKGVSRTAQTNSSGGFTVSIADSAPYVISVTDSAGKTWYSYTPTAGAVNVNPMTTLALLSANDFKPLADLVTNWLNDPLTQAEVLEAAKKVNANLQNVMTANSVAYASTNIFNGAFTANGTGMDAVLDDLGINITCSSTSCTQTIDWYNGSGTSTITWNNSIDTTGITVSWSVSTGGGTGGSGGGSTGGSTGGSIGVNLGSCRTNVQAGTYSMIVRTTVSGIGAGTIPEICVDGLPDRPTSQQEFCSDTDVVNQLPNGVSITGCSFSGNTGTISARITSPITLDYSVSYTFAQR